MSLASCRIIYENSIVHIDWINAEEINDDNVADILAGAGWHFSAGWFWTTWH